MPVLDISAIATDTQFDDLCHPEGKKISKELFNAFSTAGFACLKNHGIPEELVRKVATAYWLIPVWQAELA